METEKANVRKRINFIEILSVPLLTQIDKFIFSPNLPKKGYSVAVCQFLVKMDSFDISGENLPKNGFWSCNFKNLSPNAESAPPKYRVCQFSGKIDNFDLFGLNLVKLLNYVQCFGFDNVEGVAES